MRARRALLHALALAGLVALACTCASAGRPAPTRDAPPAQDATLVVSGGDLAFAPGQVLAADAAAPDYEVFPGKPLQTLAGFGGAFNEKGWDALGALSEADRAAVLDRIFSPGEGLSLSLCRIPIGASDYARSRYTHDDGPEDLRMERFSIARDREALIPYVKAAQARNPSLRFWGSAWTPPPWMKTSRAYDAGAMRDEPAVYAAYALYLARFVEEYGKEGIPVEAVAVQNEPTILTDYPSCRWEPRQVLTFVRDHLGPTLAARGSPAKILLGTFNQPDNERHALAVLADPAARASVGVLGLQWGGLPIARAARAVAPGIPVWHTETDCGNHHWEPGFDPVRPQNDWAYALHTWRAMRAYLAGGAELYSLWNVVLDETGRSIDAKRPWPQNSPIVVDRAARRAIFTPMYYAFAHFSRYAGAGAKVLDGQGSADVLAFRRPDGKLAVVMVNAEPDPRSVRVRIGDRAYEAVLPARAFGTMLVSP
jgi:glucosylceramidase